MGTAEEFLKWFSENLNAKDFDISHNYRDLSEYEQLRLQRALSHLQL